MYAKKRLRASRALLLLLKASVSGHSSRASQLLLLLLTGTVVSSHAAA
jgi:hypothetical protein